MNEERILTIHGGITMDLFAAILEAVSTVLPDTFVRNSPDGYEVFRSSVLKAGLEND